MKKAFLLALTLVSIRLLAQNVPSHTLDGLYKIAIDARSEGYSEQEPLTVRADSIVEQIEAELSNTRVLTPWEISDVSLDRDETVRYVGCWHKIISEDTIDVNFSVFRSTSRRVFKLKRFRWITKTQTSVGCRGDRGYHPDYRFVRNDSNEWEMILAGMKDLKLLEFLRGEWISDSIYDPNSDRWREFVFFDSQGEFHRTTRWSEKYVIDSELEVRSNMVMKTTGGVQFEIEVLDTNRIALKNDAYYGLFFRDPFFERRDEEASLNRFIAADSIKLELLGTWEYVDHNLIDPHPSFPEEYLAQKQGEPYLGMELDGLEIVFDVKNRFTVTNDSLSTSYSYILDVDEIQVARSDYIISIPYILSEYLELVSSHGGVKRRIRFRRKN